MPRRAFRRRRTPHDATLGAELLTVSEVTGVATWHEPEAGRVATPPPTCQQPLRL